MRYWDALFAFLVAMVVAALLTPLTARLARRVGAMVMPSERGLAERATPALGGLAILAGALVAALFWLPDTILLRHTAGTAPGSAGIVHTWTIMAGACLIALVGAIDDVKTMDRATRVAHWHLTTRSGFFRHSTCRSLHPTPSNCWRGH